MKKMLYGFALLCFIGAFGLSMTEAAYVSPYRSYWNSIFGNRYTTPTTSYTPAPSTYNYTPYRSTTRRYNYQYTQPQSYRNDWSQPNYTQPTRSRTYYPYSGYRSYPNYYRTPSTSGYQSQALSVTVNPIRHYQDINEITSAPISLFEVSVHNNYGGGSDYTEAVRLTELRFEMYSNTGLAADPRDFALRVDGQDFIFEANGSVTLRFHNLRLASGESESFDVDLVVRDPQNTPHIDGALRVKVTDGEAIEELSTRSVRVALDGDTFSRFINFSPSTNSSGSAGNVSALSTQIYGKTLSAGETEAVLSASFEASYDDLYIKELTLQDTKSSGQIDAFVDKVLAVDAYSGAILGETRFVNSKATFYFRDGGVRINRRTTRKLVFKVQIEDRLNQSLSNAQFQLALYPNNVEVWGIGSGRELSLSDKNFNIVSDTFYVTSGGGSMRISSSGTQPDGFAVIGTLQPVYRFTISNPGSKAVALGRISMTVHPTGVEFTDGISADDFQLKQIYNGNEANSTLFSASLAGGNKVHFDANSQVYVEAHSSLEFVLKLKLDDITSIDVDNDYVTVQILGDSNFKTGTLSSVRSSGANFIWSDLSGSPHSIESSDWISGYQLSGLPTSAYTNYRR